jgi:hypothetical protein
MRLDPLRETCVQPAPKSRLAVSGLFAYEDQEEIKSALSRSGDSRLKPVLLNERVVSSPRVCLIYRETPQTSLSLLKQAPIKRIDVLIFEQPL